LVSGTIQGPVPLLGATSQLSATARRSDSSTLDVTGLVTWKSPDSFYLTVSSGGLVTGVRLGEATVSATCAGATGAQSMRVVSPTVAPFSFLWFEGDPGNYVTKVKTQ
jgi:hypothetical protein